MTNLAPWITGPAVNVASCWPALARTQMCQVSSSMSHALEKNRRKQSQTYPITITLSLRRCRVSMSFLPHCNTWRFVPGARCRELIACRCLCAFVFPSLSTRRRLSKPCLAVLGLSASVLVHYYSIPIYPDLSRNVKYCTVGLMGACFLFMWICVSLSTYCSHNARICH